jgi:hypothetical protein
MILLIVGAFFLAGCDQVKQTLGFEKTAPDSFSINPRNRDLEIPPDFSLCPGIESKIPEKKTPEKNEGMKEAEKELLRRLPSS